MAVVVHQGESFGSNVQICVACVRKWMRICSVVDLECYVDCFFLTYFVGWQINFLLTYLYLVNLLPHCYNILVFSLLPVAWLILNRIFWSKFLCNNIWCCIINDFASCEAKLNMYSLYLQSLIATLLYLLHAFLVLYRTVLWYDDSCSQVHVVGNY